MNIVPTDNASIYAALNTLERNGERLALVRPNNPPEGVAGFLFDLVEDDGSDLESEITDHYIEDNSAVQDHIALKPETVTVSGKVAELVRYSPTASSISSVPNPLPTIPDLTPGLSPGAEDTQVATLQTQAEESAAITSTESLFGYYLSKVKQQPDQTKQSFIYNYFYQLWRGRQLFSVETPWGFFTNMAIQSISASQGPETRTVSSFDITFKKIRTVKNLLILPGLLVGRAVQQRAEETRNGVIGQTTPTTAEQMQFNFRITPIGTP